jgi:heme A synthase
MNWNRWIRQTHRWLSMAFTLAVVVNGIAVAQGKYSNKMGLTAVAVLALSFVTGLYLFVLPYAARWNNARRSG